MSLDVVIYRAGQPWAEPKLDAFVEGLRVHGIEPEERTTPDWRVSDLAVVWAHHDPGLHKVQLEAGKHYLVLERSYIGDIEERRRRCSIGYDGLNGRADFCNSDVTGERWEQHFANRMQPWRDGGDYALLMGQTRGDASLVGLDPRQWYAETAASLAGMGWTVMFRPHPNDPTVAPAKSYSLVGGLDGALDGAALAVTWNSNSGVDAVLAGVPTVAMDRGSMVWGVAARSLDHIGFKPSRTAWTHRLAWTQWLPEEMAAGHAWEHLKRKFD